MSDEDRRVVRKLRAVVEEGPPDVDFRVAGRDPDTGERLAYRFTGEDFVALADLLDRLEGEPNDR